MNKFLVSARRLINRNGVSCLFWKTSNGSVYNVETGTSSPTKTSYAVTMFPRQIIANQYNFPTLVGKEVVQFYLANDSLSFVPAVNDDITYINKKYKVVSYQEHVAAGELVLYRIIATKS